MQTETLLQTMSGLLARIATPANFTLALNPTAFNNTMISWLTDPTFHLPNGSIVGLCCSSLLGLQFQDEATTSTDGLITEPTIRLQPSQTPRPHPYPAVSFPLWPRVVPGPVPPRLGNRAGSGVFVNSDAGGDHRVSPEFPSSSEAVEMLSPEFQRSPTLWLAMKEHLCQMLAHHLIFVGSMLGIRFETGVEQRIIETAVARWNKAEGWKRV
ncbi:hypothetical protein N0V88_007926 [Collariella sp. IMI 366227]|nr:hypothetical protein N0V88_007926 [Collariella sp. IMI 366227]